VRVARCDLQLERDANYYTMSMIVDGVEAYLGALGMK
jgi:hypothetical protein